MLNLISERKPPEFLDRQSSWLKILMATGEVAQPGRMDGLVDGVGLCLFLSSFCFESGFHYVAQAHLELAR